MIIHFIQTGDNEQTVHRVESSLGSSLSSRLSLWDNGDEKRILKADLMDRALHLLTPDDCFGDAGQPVGWMQEGPAYKDVGGHQAPRR